MALAAVSSWAPTLLPNHQEQGQISLRKRTEALELCRQIVAKSAELRKLWTAPHSVGFEDDVRLPLSPEYLAVERQVGDLKIELNKLNFWFKKYRPAGWYLNCLRLEWQILDNTTYTLQDVWLNQFSGVSYDEYLFDLHCVSMKELDELDEEIIEDRKEEEREIAKFSGYPYGCC